MSTNRSSRFCIAIALWGIGTVAAAAADPVYFVQHGKARLVTYEGRAWKQNEDSIEQGGGGTVAFATRALGSGDARVKARLTIHGLSKSAASFLIGESHFGFEGSTGKMFLEGPLFGGGPRFIGPPVVAAGRPFDFSVTRSGRKLVFEVDGKRVYEHDVGTTALGRIGFRPHRSTMSISSWSASGDLVEPPRDRRPKFLVDVFTRGTGSTHTFRIPAIITTHAGTLLAFCEARRTGRGDAGDIDLVVRRSTDGGASWGPIHVIWDDGGNTCGNPCPVVDRSTGRVWLPMTWNHGKDHERQIMAGQSRHPRRVFITHSDDDGRTWAKPKEISDAVRRPHWRWYATGPGNGIQLLRGKYVGRLIIPANHSDHSDGKHPYRSHVFFSDDNGKTWQLGGVVGPTTNESTIVELDDGSILDNMRSYAGKNRRAVAISRDGGASWSTPRLDETLIEPVCQASILRYASAKKSPLMFCNPASTSRNKLTVRLSYDEGKTWSVSTMIYRGSAAYSCLTVLESGEVGVLFERDGYSRISFAKFSLDWLK